MQRFEPRAALGERLFAQVLSAVDQQIVGAQMRREVGEQLGVHGLPVEPLLQHVEALHAAIDARSGVRRRSPPASRSASIRSGKLPEMSSPVRE